MVTQGGFSFKKASSNVFCLTKNPMSRTWFSSQNQWKSSCPL